MGEIRDAVASSLADMERALAAAVTAQQRRAAELGASLDAHLARKAADLAALQVCVRGLPGSSQAGVACTHARRVGCCPVCVSASRIRAVRASTCMQAVRPASSHGSGSLCSHAGNQGRDWVGDTCWLVCEQAQMAEMGGQLDGVAAAARASIQDVANRGSGALAGVREQHESYVRGRAQQARTVIGPPERSNCPIRCSDAPDSTAGREGCSVTCNVQRLPHVGFHWQDI